MSQRTLLPIVVFLIVLGGFLGLRELVLHQSRGVRVLAVPSGDQEIAWIHTSTNTANWERFVTGIQRIPDIQVDDSAAFLDQTTGVPEVVISFPKRSNKIRVRWYKLTSEITNRQIIDALAERNPPPLAFVGGGSTDRALELAKALNQRMTWKGTRPLLLLTTATANDVWWDEESASPTAALGIRKPRDLMKVYENRTYRFCFTNKQMATAVSDFVWDQPDLKPQGPKDESARVFILSWDDDPYSIDLSSHFKDQLQLRNEPLQIAKNIIDFSVGTPHTPNRQELTFADQMLRDIPTQAGSRSLIVLPTVGPPARRVLKYLAGEFPLIGQHLVAINGDGIPFNFFYRDADLFWPIYDLPVPFVFFMHQNPIAWDSPTDEQTNRVKLLPPNSTEDVLLYSELMEHVCRGVLDENGLVSDADLFAKRLRAKSPGFFDDEGNRQEGSGEYIVWIRPTFLPTGRIGTTARIEVWNRSDGKTWKLVERLNR
jgi:hypothetical protein